MKIKYTGPPIKDAWHLTTNKEYYCSSIVFIVTNGGVKTAYTVFDDKSFLASIAEENCELIDAWVPELWKVLPANLTPIGGPYTGFTSEIQDSRLKEAGDLDILHDLTLHIDDQSETGDDFFDTDGMKMRLEELHEKIKQEHEQK